MWEKTACQIMAPLPKTRLLCTLFKDAESYDRRGGCAFLIAWKLEQFIYVLKRVRPFHQSSVGVPKEVISDRGTNFVGAVGELKKLASQLDQRHLQRKTAELGLMEIQSTRCLTYWRSPWSNDESCEESHSCRCRRTRCKRLRADHCVR